jgi:protein-tyrosine phosphatase
MIDLHCHMLPKIDDGPKTLDESIAMAKIAVHDGITVLACTPHIYQGVYNNTAEKIKEATAAFQKVLDRKKISLKLVYASDTHIHPNLIEEIRLGNVPTFNGGRYLLLEPTHHIAPIGFEAYVIKMLEEGFVPIITHPERLSYIEKFYDVMTRLVQKGAWMQITASSFSGRFGEKAKKFAIRFLVDGKIAIIASDAHDSKHRPPILSQAFLSASKVLGEDEARRLVLDRPSAVLDNMDPKKVTPVPFLIEPRFSIKKMKRYIMMTKVF